MLHRGEYVRRKSYGGDMLFRVESIRTDGIVLLDGISYRISADAPLSDLMRAGEREAQNVRRREAERIREKMEQLKSRHIQWGIGKGFSRSVRILHIDGDAEYLLLCLRYYRELGLEAYGEAIEEIKQPQEILRCLRQYQPEILVVTGHDSIPRNPADILREEIYRSSSYFAETVRRARAKEPDMDRLVIIAGACQSYYELLMEAGANYASSPGRVLIHAMDPVILCAEVAYTPLQERVNAEEAVSLTFAGAQGMGGYDTMGKGRRGYPLGRRKIISYPV